MTDGAAFERSIVWAAASDNRAAVAELFRRYNGFVRAVILPYAPTSADAEDWAQDTWCAALRGLRTYRGAANVRTWLYQVAVNQAKQGLRIWRRHESIQSGAQQFAHLTPSISEPLGNAALAAIASLPAGQQRVLRWRVFSELPHAEIAMRLGISLSTARTQYRKARLKLQRRMSASMSV